MPPSIPPRPPQHSAADAGPSTQRPTDRPWRTEGLPPGKPGPSANKPEFSWGKFIVRALLIYGAVFAFLTIQDRMNGPQAISYTEFDKQVEASNITEVFARGHSIQGELRAEKPIPEPKPKTGDGKYKRFSTERPVFAQDDLMERLEKSKATVRATPLVEERGLLTNLLISFSPILLMIAFYAWLAKRQQASMGGLFGHRNATRSCFRRPSARSREARRLTRSSNTRYE